VEGGDGSGWVVLILDDGAEVRIRCLDGRSVDLALVDELAWLQLAARRAGSSIALRRPPPSLCRLLGLVGLDDVIEGAALGLEAHGQAEEGEQLGVQEVLPGGDAPA
jgi:hypothetical protein